MENRIPQDELNAHLWNAAVLLRTYIDAGSYKQYIFPLLFFKRLSDVYDEETAEALESSGGDAEYAALPENHGFAIPEGAHWGDVREATENVGKAIVGAFRAIEAANGANAAFSATPPGPTRSASPTACSRTSSSISAPRRSP